MSPQIFRVFCISLIFSICSIVLATSFLPASDKTASFVTVLVGMVPLVYYHWFFLFPLSKKGLDQGAVDSVYYFGFLVTVCSLAAGAVHSVTGKSNLAFNAVLSQFGLGLIATAYAVFARIHLSSVAIVRDGITPEEVLDEHLLKSRTLLENMETAILRTGEFAESVIKKTEAINSATRLYVEETLKASADSFTQELNSALEELRVSVKSIRGMVTDSSFKTEHAEFKKIIDENLQASRELNREMSGLSKNVLGTSESLREVTSYTQVFLERISGLTNEIDGLTSADTGLSMLKRVVVESVIEFGDCADNIKQILSVLSAAGKDVERVSGTFKVITSSSKKAEAQLTTLEGVLSKMSESTERVVEMAAGYERYTAALGKASSDLPVFHAAAREFGDTMGELTTEAAALVALMKDISNKTGSIGGVQIRLANLIDDLNQKLSSTAVEAKNVSDNIGPAGQVVQAAKTLAESSGLLQNTVKSLRNSIEELPPAIDKFKLACSSGGGNIEKLVAGSVDRLETDLKRSAEVTSLLAANLSNVADYIISETKRKQA